MTDSNEPRYSPPVSTDVEGDNVPPTIPHVPLAGNTADDDGTALDKFFEGMPVGAQEFEGAVHSPESLPQTHRILSRTLPLNADGEPIQFFPGDPRRTMVSIQILGGVVEDTNFGIQFASSKDECYGAAVFQYETSNNSGAITSNNQIFNLGDYTGPIWIRNNIEGQAGVKVSVWCVTF